MTVTASPRPKARPTFNVVDLRDFLDEVLDPLNSCAEMRVFEDAQFDRSGHVVPSNYSAKIAGWFNDPQAFIAEAQRLKGVSGYITVNPVIQDLLARSNNRLQKMKSTTNDTNILCRRWFFIDVDPKRPDGISSTDEELAKAVATRDAILTDHPGIAAHSLWGKSGNGAWILTRLPDYPCDDKHYDLADRALKILDSRYGGDAVSIDASTKNVGRIMCLPGTLKCKGEDFPGRPWRLATFDGAWGVER